MEAKIAVVTGASAGIGWELARQLAAKGISAWLVARRAERLQALKELIEKEGGPPSIVLPLDLGDTGARRELIRRMEEAGAALELVVNNAGFGALSPTLLRPPSVYEAMVELNVVALTELSWEAARLFAARKRGGIINVASTASFQAVPYMGVYAATKAYVLSFTESLAIELEGSGVRVMALCPGFTRSEFQQVAGMNPDDPRLRFAMNPRDCARIGLADFERGKRLSITGTLNRLQVFGSWLAPRGIVTRLAAKVMKSQLRK
jgi:uncharacterized protein